MTSAKVRAKQLWASVLEDMPPDLHRRHALVQARRQLIGMENEAEVAAEIDRLAAAAFGADQVAPVSAPAVDPASRSAKPSLTDIEEQVRLAVCGGFEGTTDGSRERAEFFRKRGLSAAEDVIARHGVGWLKRRRLRALAQEVAEDQVKVVTAPPRG